MATLDVVRRFYARLITARGEVDDARIVEAFASVERERFLGPAPWQIWVGKGYLSSETADPVVLYQDFLVALAADKGIHNGEPSLHARSIGAASPKPGDVVIHVGAGTGYYTAVLASLVPRPCARIRNRANAGRPSLQHEAAYAARVFSPAGFIPCIGARDPDQSQALYDALDTRDTSEIRSLRRSGEPDETAWCVGKGWWLSTAAPPQ